MTLSDPPHLQSACTAIAQSGLQTASKKSGDETSNCTLRKGMEYSVPTSSLFFGALNSGPAVAGSAHLPLRVISGACRSKTAGFPK